MFKPHKELGQNFLNDKKIVIDMVNALEIENGDEVIEIGPGPGLVTGYLLEKAKKNNAKIHAVELDARLYRNLSERFLGDGDIKIYHENILDWLSTFTAEKEFKIIGSIPYYITSPIIHKIIKMEKRPETVVLLVQKEVAEKIKSTSPDSSYMSSFVQTFFDVKYLGKVPSKKFTPEPKVDGGILKLVLTDKGFDREFIRKYEGFLHKAYSNPRKMLNKVFKQDELEKGKINSQLRAQNLGAGEWLSFYKILNEI